MGKGYLYGVSSGFAEVCFLNGKEDEMKNKKQVLVVIVGLLISAGIAGFLSLRANEVLAKRNVAGVYVFERSIDGVRYTCQLQPDGICFLGVELPGTTLSMSKGDIPAGVTRDATGSKGGKGLCERWELRRGKVLVFPKNSSIQDFVFNIQGQDLLTPDGAVYTRVE